MQLDSVMVRCGSPADLRRLRRAGGEAWQTYGQTTAAGGIRWAYVLVRLSAAAAIRLRLVAPGAGAEFADVPSGAARER